MVITITDPDTLFAQALKAGAKEVFPVGEEYGWRLEGLLILSGYIGRLGDLLIHK